MRGKIHLIVVASFAAAAGLVLSYVKPGGYILDYMAVCLPFSCLMVILAIVKYDFLEIKSLARSKSFEANKDALLLLDRQYRIIDYNEKARMLFAKMNIILSEGYLDSIFQGAPLLLDGLKNKASSVVPLTIDGDERYYEISTNCVEQNGSAQVCIKTINDVTEAYELNLRLQRQALMDELSGLYNRRAFIQKGGEMLAQAVKDGKTVHLLMMDLDYFKSVNDEFGHQMGDQMIQYMGNTLKASFPADSLAVRLGGEEFGVLLAGFSDEDVLECGNQFVREVASHVHQAQGKCFRLTVSVGIARLQNARQSLYDLMLMADRALYRSKDAGRNRVSR